mmetsp:Transcript_62965/g.73645  ORF Transcript_62965/g.73645 Transcript_62965/m.73645 type:complete len:109 (-) Transcript_62965:937-1263(-)
MDVEKERYCQGLFDFGGELFGMVTRWVRSSLDEGFLERFRDTTDVVCFLVRQSQHTVLATWRGIGLYDRGRKKDKNIQKASRFSCLLARLGARNDWQWIQMVRDCIYR